jgi:hypothetical protein
LRLNNDFTVEPFKLKPAFRSDKGKKHNYPKERRLWSLLCHGHYGSNLSFNQTGSNSAVMDNVKAFKHSVELREYWRLAKRKQRAQAGVAKEVKTEKSKKFGSSEQLV